MKLLTSRRMLRMAWQSRRRTVAAIMLPVYFFTSLPPNAFAATTTTNNLKPVLTPKNVHVNKQKPKFTPYAGVQLANQPTDHDITYSHAFQEPLVPVGSKTTAAENQALGEAIKTFLRRKSDEDVSDLLGFLSKYPSSAWGPSLNLNLAEVYYQTGNFSKALDAWQDAWDHTQNLIDPAGQQVANLAVAKLAKMKARIGRTDELDALFQQIKGRNISGTAAQLLVEARSGLWLMKTHPQDAFRCGPSALQELSLATKHKIDRPELIKLSQSTPKGIALSDLSTFSSWIKMPMQMAKRSKGASFIVPAVVHWKLGHYAAIVGQRDGKYEIHDTTFGGSRFLVSAQTLEQETSGYFLVPADMVLPHGWTSVDKKEGSGVLGRGNTNLEFSYAYTPCDGDSGDGDCGTGGTGVTYNNPDSMDVFGNELGDMDTMGIPEDILLLPMTVPFVKSLLVSLNLVDTPIRYSPPIGPAMHFTVQYNQREIAQPSILSYSNLGPNWTFSYMSYVRPQTSQAQVYVRGGGVETYYYDGYTGGFYPNQISQAVLAQVNSTTWTRSLPGGEVETYGEPDGSGSFYLTKITDPQNRSLTLNYDSHFRLISLTDAIGQVTRIDYGNPDLPYLITKVTDPFGRHAQFDYDNQGRLQKITDIIGITSQFAYQGSGTFVTSLTTPYGITGFAYGDISTDPSLGDTRWLEVTYPDGNKTRTEYNKGAPGITNSDPSPFNNCIPSGMYSGLWAPNDYKQYRNTYFWDKQTMKDHPGDYTKAQITHWLHTSDSNTCSNIQESIKKPDQNRIWYGYDTQLSEIAASDTMIAKPNERGRILDDGSTQLYQYEYNSIGKVTKQIDPLGRETDYEYYSNNIDLKTIKQKNGGSWDILASYTYNSNHQPLTVVDASGQTTTYTYYTTFDYSNGQLHTVIDAKGNTTTYTYDSNGYLQTVTGPVSGSTVIYGYDGYGRVRYVTDSQNYVTTTDYDDMDRPTQVTYPDSTTNRVIYSNLDPSITIDRLGRWSKTFYNSVRQPIATLDSLGRTTNTTWTLSSGPSSVVDAAGNKTSYQYDNQNRLTQKTYADGHNYQIQYEDTTNRIWKTTDPLGQVTTRTYNLDNSIAELDYSGGTTPSDYYTYDPIYPRTIAIAKGTGSGAYMTAYEYNAVPTSLPAVGANKLKDVKEYLGATLSGGTLTGTTLLYTISYLDSMGTPLYDELGRSTGQSIDGVASSQTYDTLGRIDTATNALLSSGHFTYTYLANTGRVASMTNPNGQSTIYTYQDSTTTPNEPRLSELKNLNAASPQAVISKFNYGYDAQGQITSWTQQTDTNDPQNYALQYDMGGRLINANVTDTTTSAVLHQYAYTYDGAGNRTSEQIDGDVISSSYNNLNQMTGQSSGGSMVFSGTLTKPGTVTVGGNPATVDASNNFRGMATVTNGVNTVPIVAHDFNGNVKTNNYQVTIPSTSSSYSYDYNGNLLSDGTRTFQWDAKNELVAIIYASTHTEFAYDGLGNRVQIVERAGTTVGSGTVSSTKNFVWAGGGIAEERDGSNVVTKRFFGQGEQRISGGTPTNYFYTRDHLGSIREVMASDGTTIAARYSYDPYGRRTKISGSIDCDFGFTGHYWHDPSGLYLSPTRAYDPNLGRWIQRDPSGEGSGLNLYEYCGDNPVNNSDPSGLFCMDWDTSNYSPDDLWDALSASSLTPSEALSEYLEAMASFDAAMVMSDEASFAALMHETGPNDPSWVLDAALIALADPEALPVEAAEEAEGGVYLLRDAEGTVVRTGRTGDLAAREGQHALDPALKDFDFETVYRTDNYAEQRGLEQMLHDAYVPRLNYINPISPTNPNRQLYLDAAQQFLDKQ